MMLKKICLAAVCSVMISFVGAASAQSGTSGAPSVQQSREAVATAFDPVEHKRVLGISEQLRCLVCQNQSIADSNAELAVDLRNQVIEQINAGRSDEEIIKYMVDRYGDFVLYNPPFKASTVILWVGPAVLFFGAVIAFYINLRRRKTQVAQSERALTPDEKRRAEALLRGDK